jgi:hypothetical protein
MTTAGSLTPALALAYLRELSVDVREALVLGPAGEVLAGDAALADRARAALAAGERIVRSHDGALVLSRGGNGIAIAVAAGPKALLELLAHDVGAVADGVVAG